MALLAMLYGVLSHGSIWYPINLLAGSLYAPSAMPSDRGVAALPPGMVSLCAGAPPLRRRCWSGLLYGAMLPMLPDRPILLGGIIAPLHVDRIAVPRHLATSTRCMDERINWWWFAVSQVAFGVVAGLVVVRQNKVWTTENLPLAMRAGIEAPGIMMNATARTSAMKRRSRFAGTLLAMLLALHGLFACGASPLLVPRSSAGFCARSGGAL